MLYVSSPDDESTVLPYTACGDKTTTGERDIMYVFALLVNIVTDNPQHFVLGAHSTLDPITRI